MAYDLKNILILDIETVSSVSDYKNLDGRLQKEWDKKSSNFKDADLKSSSELFENRAGIYAEFGKIVTIALGFFITNEEDHTIGLRVKSLANDEESILLNEFKELLESKFDQNKLSLCGHNGKEFDFPYLCRRMIVNGIALPDILNTAGKKPWEVNHIDTMDLWKFGDRKNFTSLDLLASLFDIPSSKGNIDGSMVSEVYYQENNLKKIAEYCMHDVAVTAQVFLKLNNIQNFDSTNIQFLPIK